ncbi:hypothetical protein [Bradyrhizobium sp. CSA112]|uniref:hypothetical protein n=1 Tax=Bradyrhizobium sp. CSA112 TaxID=2699170 RepID=UPI0023B14536|nr:hypothetical protein [Bradyrhizobium sp. CSA112]
MREHLRTMRFFSRSFWQGGNRIGLQASLIDWKNRSLMSLLNGRDLSVKRPRPALSFIFIAFNGASRRASPCTISRREFLYKYDFGGLERRAECLRVTTHDQQNLRGKLEPLSLPVVFGRARGLRPNETRSSRTVNTAIDAGHAMPRDPSLAPVPSNEIPVPN